jgi:hypothetical protein
LRDALRDERPPKHRRRAGIKFGQFRQGGLDDLAYLDAAQALGEKAPKPSAERQSLLISRQAEVSSDLLWTAIAVTGIHQDVHQTGSKHWRGDIIAPDGWLRLKPMF